MKAWQDRYETTPGALGYVSGITAMQNTKWLMPKLEKRGWRICEAVAGIDHSGPGHGGHFRMISDFRSQMPRARMPTRFVVQRSCLSISNKRMAKESKKLVEFRNRAAKDGEQMAKDLEYAPLPESLQQRVRKRIDRSNPRKAPTSWLRPVAQSLSARREGVAAKQANLSCRLSLPSRLAPSLN